jgi:hypothetical protein
MVDEHMKTGKAEELRCPKKGGGLLICSISVH